FFNSFPHLVGTVFALQGDDLQERATELALLPAACYPVYPSVAARGPLTRDGLTIDTGPAYVFRHEPSDDPGRLQSFHMRVLALLRQDGLDVDDWPGEVRSELAL